MNYNDPYELISSLNQTQRNAGVEADLRALVCAYARLRVDAGKDIDFYGESHRAGGTLDAWMQAQMRKHPEWDVRVHRFFACYAEEMQSRGRIPLFSTDHLAALLGMTPKQLFWMAHHTEIFYREFTVSKREKGRRTIHAPKGKLRLLQQWLKQSMLDAAEIHPAATAFYKGASIINNASRHQGCSVVVRIDLKDFFPSIPFRRVRKAYEQLGYPYQVAVILAGLSVRKGRLPQGACTSPALSNIVCRTLDHRLAGLGAANAFTYSRYADDLIFSSRIRNFTALIPFLKEIIAAEGFAVQEQKLHVMRSGQRQNVTGVVVNDTMNIPRKQYRLLRAAAHRASINPDTVMLKGRNGGADALSVLNGHIAFTKMVNPLKAEKLNHLMHKHG